jgi:hypothetical protein
MHGRLFRHLTQDMTELLPESAAINTIAGRGMTLPESMPLTQSA